jgi:Ni,Fe-hydrogenase I small subunit
VWLEKAQCAGFTELLVVRRQPMTVQRLMHYPVYQEGLLKSLFALVAPEQRDQLVESALICARAGGVPRATEQGDSCSLPPSLL